VSLHLSPSELVPVRNDRSLLSGETEHESSVEAKACGIVEVAHLVQPVATI